MGKVTIPSFDGSSQMSTSAWLQKLSLYFKLNPIVEEVALKMTIFHIKGEYRDWQFDGMRTMGLDNILYDEVFANELMEIFELKDFEIPFNELAQLKKVGTLKAYMLEFENI